MCRTNKKRIVCFFLVFSLCLCSCKKQGTEIILDDVGQENQPKEEVQEESKGEPEEEAEKEILAEPACCLLYTSNRRNLSGFWTKMFILRPNG